MFFVDTVEVPGLGNRSYLAGGPTTAVVVDPPRDIDRVIAAAALRGVRISHVVETHVHNDYVSGGHELARITGAVYVVPAAAPVSYERLPVADGDTLAVGEGLVLRAVATPGHTPHHTAYVLEEGGEPVAVFTGGSLLVGTVGRPDLVEPRLTASLARAQHASAHRLAAELPDATTVLPTHGFGSMCAAARSGNGAGSPGGAGGPGGPGSTGGTGGPGGSGSPGGATTIGEQAAVNEAFAKDVDTFVADLLAGLDDIPAYYAHMGPLNSEGPAPVDLTPPAVADADEIAARLAAGEWVVDLRSRVAFAEGHVAGSYNIEAGEGPGGQLAVLLAWLIPWGRPVTLLADSPERLARAQRELVRVGIDRPAAAATGTPEEWVPEGERPASFRRAVFADLASELPHRAVLLDVRRASERASAGHVEGSRHIPLHELRSRMREIPSGVPVWVHCAGGLRASVAASLLAAAGREVVAVDDSFANAPVTGR
ncbi:rhodanese-like domain-containing protein [Streptomyces sp. NPDC127114]|uniref:MBL fold metallo-hydrolase n=1 Tax=Streptomyces sp. NPDC127114 TaxID=3345366 RepID=UPI00362AC680